MDAPKFEPIKPPATPHSSATAAALQQEGVDRQRAVGGELAQIRDLLQDCPQETTVNGETTRYSTVELVENLKSVADHTGALLADALERIEKCKRLLRDLVAAGVLTDGFMTMAVGQSLLAQAEAAKKLLQELETP